MANKKQKPPQPTDYKVDAVYVVPCKECKHCVSFDKRLYCNHENGMLQERTQCDFCSYGERREGE